MKRNMEGQAGGEDMQKALIFSSFRKCGGVEKHIGSETWDDSLSFHLQNKNTTKQHGK